jgi:hypothetical protein
MMFLMWVLLFVIRQFGNYKVLMINQNTFSIVKSRNLLNEYGCDNRFPSNNKNITEIQNIRKLIENKNKLDVLQNENINIHIKLEVIKENENNIKSPNVLECGLMRDFNFVFE